MPTAFAFMNTEPAAMPQVLKKVKEIKGVEEAEMVYRVYGEVIVKVKTETIYQFKHIITYNIGALPNVHSTQPFLVTQQE